MTFEQIRKHSLPQVRLIIEAAEQRRAETVQMEMRAFLGAASYAFTGKNATFNKIDSDLMRVSVKEAPIELKKARSLVAAKIRSLK